MLYRKNPEAAKVITFAFRSFLHPPHLFPSGDPTSGGDDTYSQIMPLSNDCSTRTVSEIKVSCGFVFRTLWRSGESARLPPMCPRFDSRTRRHMWVEFVVGSLLCCERFFSVYSGFLLSDISNSNSILKCTGISERVLVNSFFFAQINKD